MKVDVIIPTYRPQGRFLEILTRLEQQTVPVDRIIVMNTDEEKLKELVDISRFLQSHPKVLLTHLEQAAFDHGATRNAGVSLSEADIFVCMTQDALPADDRLIEKLVRAVSQEDRVAVAYARQLSEEDCNEIERFTRQFNYPEQSFVKDESDIPRLGIKTFFCSNVCAAYRREVFDRLGGFVDHTIFNEDMIYAAHAVKAGFGIAYAADAQVIHSHNYTAKQQFSRNFDLGVSHAQHPEIFESVPPEGEGMKLVKKTALYLAGHHPFLLPKLFVQSAAKFLGYRLGKKYESLPRGLVRRFSMQKSYWDRGL